tara:strand:+ start:452 stop:1240 length:789 start_codon:yes stop_codon:yes gene_type:complete
MQFIGADGQLKEQFIDTDGSVKFRNVGSNLQFTPFQDNFGIVNTDLIKQLIEKNRPSNIFDTSTFLAKQQEGDFRGLDRSARAAKEADFASGILGLSELEPSFQGLDYDEEATGVVTEDDEEEKGGFLKGIQNYLDNAGIIGTLINSIFRPKESDFYRPATMGIMGFTPRQLNRMNALGGFYSEPAREQRRLENRLANLIKRKAEGKNYSEKNLQDIKQALSGAPSQAQFATEKRASRSPGVGVSGFTSRDAVRDSRRGFYG